MSCCNRLHRDILKKCHEFGQQTTIQCVNNVCHREKGLKYVWLFVSVFGVVMTTIHLYFHASNFLRATVTVEIGHRSIPFDFPDVTLCSMTPTVPELNHDMTKTLIDGMTYNDILVLGTLYSLDEARNLNNTADFKAHKRQLYNQIASYDTIFKSYSKQDMVIQCTYRGEDCMSRLKLVQNPHYWNCYTLVPEMRAMHSAKPEDGLVLIVNTNTVSLDEIAKMNKLKDNPHNSIIINDSVTRKKHKYSGDQAFTAFMIPETEPSGLKIVIHAPNTYPYPREMGFIVNRGQFVEIGLRMTAESKLSKGGSVCRTGNHNVRLRRAKMNDFRTEFDDFEKSFEDCSSLARQDVFIKICNCTSHYFPLEDPIKHELCYNYSSYLENILRDNREILPKYSHEYSTLNITERQSILYSLIDEGQRLNKIPYVSKQKSEFLKRQDCHDTVYKAKRMYDEIVRSTNCANTLPCHTKIYSYQWSGSAWPRYFDLDSIIGDIVIPALRNNTTGEPLVTASRLIEFSNKTRHWTTTVEAVRANLLKLVIHALELESNLHSEQYAYSIWEALSELGGIIGLWMGISLLAIFEVIELFLRIVFHGLCSKKKPSVVENNNNNDCGTELL